MASGVSNASQDKSNAGTKEIALDPTDTEALLVSQPSSSADTKTVQLVLAQPSQPSQQLGGGSSSGRAPVVIASVSASELTKKSSLVAKLAQSGGEHLTGGQVAKICASTPQMNSAMSGGSGSGKPKAFAALMGPGSGDSAASAAVTPKKQSTSKKGTVLIILCGAQMSRGSCVSNGCRDSLLKFNFWYPGAILYFLSSFLTVDVSLRSHFYCLGTLSTVYRCMLYKMWAITRQSVHVCMSFKGITTIVAVSHSRR